MFKSVVVPPAVPLGNTERYIISLIKDDLFLMMKSTKGSKVRKVYNDSKIVDGNDARAAFAVLKTVEEERGFKPVLELSVKDVEVFATTIARVVKEEPAKRFPQPESVKEILLKRFDYHCPMCGKEIDMDSCHIDHAIPFYIIGNDFGYKWLQPLCPSCNIKKQDAIMVFLNEKE